MYNLYNMKVLTTTAARKQMSSLINLVKMRGEVIGIGRRKSIDALLIQFPSHYNPEINEITNVNAFSRSFDFLQEEPELYSLADLKKTYV